MPKQKPVQLEILRWVGALGHRFVVIQPDDSDHGKLYGGFRCVVEAGTLHDALINFNKEKGQRIFQKKAKPGKYGAVIEQWFEVTP